MKKAPATTTGTIRETIALGASGAASSNSSDR
jgi:hypothetical protein